METELYSQSVEEQFTLVVLEAYAAEGTRAMLESEALLVRALELRDWARAVFERANKLALEYATVKASQLATPPDSDPGLDW